MILFNNEQYSKCLGRTKLNETNGHSFGPGTRSIYTIHCVVKGKGYLCTHNKTYHIVEGESFIIYPNTLVSYYPDPEDPWEYEWVNFTGAEAEALLAASSFSPNNLVLPAVDESPKKFFRQLCVELDYAESHYSNPDLWFCLGNAYLRIILAFYIAHYPNHNNKKNGLDYIENMVDFIKENIANHSLTVDLLADKFNLSRSSLFRIFKTSFGISPKEYIINKRMELASKMLIQTSHSIKSIALSVGFENSMYFSKIFKQRFGLTPSEYRTK